MYNIKYIYRYIFIILDFFINYLNIDLDEIRQNYELFKWLYDKKFQKKKFKA